MARVLSSDPRTISATNVNLTDTRADDGVRVIFERGAILLQYTLNKSESGVDKRADLKLDIKI